MTQEAKEFLSKFSTKKDALTAIDEIINALGKLRTIQVTYGGRPNYGKVNNDRLIEHWQTLKTTIEGMEENG